MARIFVLLVLSLQCMLACHDAVAQRRDSALHLSISLASDYKYNGLSQTNSQPSARFSADYEHATGFFAGGFVANVEYAAERYLRNPRDSLVNLYAGYDWHASDWHSNISVSRYVYPDVDFDYDYTQARVGLSYRDRYFLSLTRSDSYLFTDWNAYQYRAGAVWPLPGNMELGINAGQYKVSAAFLPRFTFWDIGLSKVIRRFALDWRYHDDTYGRTTILGDSFGDRWVFTATYAIMPRDRPPADR